MKRFPQFEQRILRNELSPEQILVLAANAVSGLNWQITVVNDFTVEAKTNFSWKSWDELVIVSVEADAIVVKSVCSRDQKTDWGKNKKNVEAFVASFESIRGNLSQDKLSSIDSDMFIRLKESAKPSAEESAELLPEEVADEKTEKAYWFVPRKNYVVTPILAFLITAAFLVMILFGVSWSEPSGEELINWGANIRVLTLDGEWWRLITSTFLHIGLFHLIMNLYALIYIGFVLEPLVGGRRFLLVYILSGLVGSVASLWFNEHVVSAGASGAIFGMFGMFLVLLLTDIIPKVIRWQLLLAVSIFILYNLVSGIKGNVDNEAHIGGLLAGMFCGLVLLKSVKHPQQRMRSYFSEVLLIVVGSVLALGLINKIPNDMPRYEANMRKVEKLEKEALKVLSITTISDSTAMIEAFRENGILKWEEMDKILLQNNRLSIPGHLEAHNELLLSYSYARRKSYEFHLKNVLEKTDRYNDSLQFYDDKIAFYLLLMGNGFEAYLP